MSTSIHADATETVRISAHRFEESPFNSCYATDEIVMGVYAGRFHPVFNGENVIEKYWTLRRKCALYDVPERPVEISGPDAVALLERVFARRIATLKPGRGRYVIACTPQGGLYMDGVLFRLADDRFWFVQPDGALEPWLIAHGEGLEATISDPHSWVLQIQGPTSPAVMRDATDGAVDDTLGYFHSGFFDVGGQRVYVSRTGWTAELGYEVYTQGDETDCTRLWAHLLAAGAPHGMEVSAIPSMEIRRIEAGILDNLTDFDRTMTPFEAGLGAFIDLEKDGFVGRAALLKAERAPRLFGIKCPGATPGMRDRIVDGDATVGRVTAGAWSPYLDCGVGYARFERAGGWVGRTLSLIGEGGAAHECEIVALPFYDAEKRIPRGLDRTIP
ncbi:aminomethyl transferase family protein [Pikeienuella piscinae]|uniref:Aminomethyl transferase family protein n=1 Tax=Pikeienuella piscinae TaxID=2748098 RepID=A0A7L5BUY7_9RHOB|nr:aminomethyltransferase family protein [Pikeienuella piscinae]QIE53976.1 aminomethyl transferase family protein [Pikeienuella piscinae]